MNGVLDNTPYSDARYSNTVPQAHWPHHCRVFLFFKEHGVVNALEQASTTYCHFHIYNSQQSLPI